MNKKYKYWTKIQFPDNFCYSGVDFDYDTERHCEEHGCSEDGICRCSTIENIEVKNIDINEIYNTIINSGQRLRVDLNFKQDDEFVNYCVYRLLIINKLYETSNWEVSTCRGYYGEEIDKVQFCDFNTISKQIDTLYSISAQERICRILRMEYGFVFVRVSSRIKYIPYPCQDKKFLSSPSMPTIAPRSTISPGWGVTPLPECGPWGTKCLVC